MAQSQPKGWQNTLERLYHRHNPSQVYRDAVRMIACALSMQTREVQYLECSKRYKKEELEVFPEAMAELIGAMEREPYTDLLGDPFLELESKSTKQGRIFRKAFPRCSATLWAETGPFLRPPK